MEIESFLARYAEFKLNLKIDKPQPILIKIQDDSQQLVIKVLVFGQKEIPKFPPQASIDQEKFQFNSLLKSELYALSDGTGEPLLVRYLELAATKINTAVPEKLLDYLSANNQFAFNYCLDHKVDFKEVFTVVGIEKVKTPLMSQSEVDDLLNM